MVLKTEGSLSLTEIKEEFKNLSGDVAFSDLYGIAEGVNTTGSISMSVMLGKAYVFLKLLNGTFTNLDVSTLFTAEEWASDTPKEVRFSSTSIVGATSTATPAIRTGSGGLGTLKIVNAGSIIGAGGISPGSSGGHAIEVQRANVTIVNSGLIAGGGGAGGSGGQGATGGGGSYVQVIREPSSGEYQLANYYVYYETGTFGGRWAWYWGSTTAFSTSSSTAVSSGGVTYYRATLFYDVDYEYRSGPDGDTRTGVKRKYGIYRVYNTTVYTSGGVGGAGTAGGRGAGYNQSAVTPAAGALGAAGGTNAGAGGQGGRGGAGGAYGQPGAAGATGGTASNGNYTGAGSPAAGTAGGIAGRAITGLARVLENTGSIQGTVNV